MRNWKKLAALGIAGTMLVGGASFGVFASTEDEKPEVSLSLTDNSVSVEAEETEAETEADGQQVLTADPRQIAHVSNIVARALSGVMNNS